MSAGRAAAARHREVNHAVADILQVCGHISSMESIENRHPGGVAVTV